MIIYTNIARQLFNFLIISVENLNLKGNKLCFFFESKNLWEIKLIAKLMISSRIYQIKYADTYFK